MRSRYKIEDRCVNASVVPDYLRQDYTATTPHDYLSLIAPLTEGEHIVEAVQATAEGVRAAAYSRARPVSADPPPHLVHHPYRFPRAPDFPRQPLPSAGPFWFLIFLRVGKT
ncbi:Histidine utilization repressor [Klebsiella michiganensis]|uniref:Histidine utilization repressor n=1 Tax=Klebsiella michiganensis TaxID=1134687 RepID=A0A7H4N3I8_9ENTR|nr:Histidine utilization repressor [Klebsiella michiganensis]